MRNLTSIVLAFASAVAIGAHAERVTSDVALSRVLAQMNAHTTSSHRAPITANAFVPLLQEEVAPAYYVFNRTSGGFVIAPADDAQPAILALIDEGHYDETTLPDGFKAWLKEVTTCGAAKAPAQAPAASVSPLLAEDQIAWTQTAPYYNECPKFLYQGYNYETLAGCAAIAAGQIMRYHKYPAYGLGSVRYESLVNVSGQDIVTTVDRDFSEHNYDWTKIRGNYEYSGSGTKEERAEVAKFVADVACASLMNFDLVASATYDYRVAQALKYNFGYDPSLQLIDHANYTTAEWADILRAELDAGRPVYLSGANVTTSSDGRQSVSGHAFVCDGYNADGLFHINWGWGGTSDGYFALTSLNPQKQGAGGSAGGYSFMANAIIGIQPDQGGEEAKAVISLDNEYWETTYDTENDGYVIRANIANLSASDFEGFVAMRFMEGDRVLLDAKQNAKATKALAGAGGQYSLGLDRESLMEHPTVRMELVYVHCAGVMTASAAERTAMLEGIADDEWIDIACREGAPRSLQAFMDSKNQFTFGSVPEEVYQLRFAGLDADKSPVGGRMVTFTAKVTNESDYEYFAPLYLFIYDSGGNQIAYSDYDLHLLPAHSTKKYNFTMTLPSGYSSFRYAMAYEDKGYYWNYLPMRLSNADSYSTAYLFDDNVPVTPDPEQPGTDPDEPDPDEPGYTPAAGAKVYYVKNVDSGYYLNVIEHDRSCAVLSETPEVLYFEPTAVADEYIIKGHTGLYLGGHEDNTWNMSSSCPETWIVETQADGSVAFHAKSNVSAVTGYIGFDTSYFQFYALGAAAKRNQRTTAHGLFLLEPVGDEPGTDPEQPGTDPEQPGTDPEQPGTDPEQPDVDATIAAVGDPVAIPGGTFPTTGAGYYLKNVDSGCYLIAVPSDKKSALLSHTPEELFFTASGAGYTIKDADGNYIGKYDTPTASNTWNISSTVPEIWTLEEISTGKYALKAASSKYLGFDDKDTNVTPNKNFATDADGFAAFRDKNYATNHGLFTIEPAHIYGDVDENRTVNIADVDALVNILLRKKDVTPEADTDLSRFITIGDLTKLIKYLNNK